jgi:hypothetical protein
MDFSNTPTDLYVLLPRSCICRILTVVFTAPRRSSGRTMYSIAFALLIISIEIILERVVILMCTVWQCYHCGTNAVFYYLETVLFLCFKHRIVFF